MNKHLKFIIVGFTLYTLSISIISAQSFLSQLSYDINIGRGFFMSDSLSAPHLATTNPNIIEARILYQSQGKKDWERWYQNPRYGIVLNYIDLRNSILGSVIGMQWVGDFPLVRKKKSQFNLMAGIGAGWVTNTYDRIENHKNRLISNPLNVSALLRVHYRTNISENLHLQFGIGLTHFSNGATRVPNTGIDYISANIGLSFQKSATPSYESHQSEKPKWNKKRYIDFYAAGGWMEQFPTDGRKYRVFNANLTFSQRMSKKFTLQTGFDFVYNEVYTEWKHDGIWRDPERISWVVGGEIPMGNFATFFHIGIYIYSPHQFNLPYYTRLGWKYTIFKGLYGIFAVKAQNITADNLEFGLGYRF